MSFDHEEVLAIIVLAYGLRKISCQQSWHQTHPDCFLCLSLSFALAFPSAAVLNNLWVFLVTVHANTFEDFRYGISHTPNFGVSGCICICLHIHAYV